MPAIKESHEATHRPQAGNGAKGKTAEVTPHTEATPAPMTALPAMRRFAEEVDRFFDDFGMGLGWHWPRVFSRSHEMLRRETGLIPAEWSPRIEVTEREGQLVVKAELPGMTKDDVSVELTDESLTIQGERRQEKKESRDGYLYNECTYGRFFRAIPLPEGAETQKATAQFVSGVLEVAMPYAHKNDKKARRIEVREGK